LPGSVLLWQPGVAIQVPFHETLRRHGGAARASWYSVRDVGPEHIRRVITFGELSRSPVEEGPPPRPRLAKAG
jgi:hypothetical protein